MITKPMLAAKMEKSYIDKLFYPLMASPKLDGIRAVIIDGEVLSRNMEPIRNRFVQELFGNRALNGLDGELIVGSPTSPMCMRDTSSGVMSHEGKPDVGFYVFDDFSLEGTFLERFSRATARVHRMKKKRLRLVPHEKVDSYQHLTLIEERHLLMGYEGTMLRGMRGPYKQGRSTLKEGHLVKLKRFEDAEAVVVGYQEMNHNDNEAVVDAKGHTKRSTMAEGLRAAGVLGALVCRLPSGEEFNIGSGFTASDRSLLWMRRDSLIGKLAKYRFFPTGYDKPRFPVFLGFRDPTDL